MPLRVVIKERLRKVMPSESTIDLDEHADRIARIVLRARIRASNILSDSRRKR